MEVAFEDCIFKPEKFLYVKLQSVMSFMTTCIQLLLYGLYEGQQVYECCKAIHRMCNKTIKLKVEMPQDEVNEW